jgi:hypothetical protein
MCRGFLPQLKIVLGFALAMLLTACATQLVPDNFKGETAILRDSYGSYRDGGWLNTDTAHFFIATKVDGKIIANSLSETAGDNYGRGFSMTPVPFERRVPIKTMRVDLLGTTHHAADVGILLNKNYSVRRTVTFTPQPGGRYVVKGKLGDTGSSVWIESEDGTVVAK